MNYPKAIKAFYMRVNDDGRTAAAMDVLAPGIGEIIGVRLSDRVCVRRRWALDAYGAVVFRSIQKIYSARADQGSHQNFCYTGEGRCPCHTWVPAFAGKTRTGSSR
jgi:hypothetical protein